MIADQSRRCTRSAPINAQQRGPKAWKVKMHQNEIRTAADVRAAGGLERLKENHSIVDVKEQHFRSSLRKHVWPGHEQAVLGARFEVKARAARPLSDPDTR